MDFRAYCESGWILASKQALGTHCYLSLAYGTHIPVVRCNTLQGKRHTWATNCRSTESRTGHQTLFISFYEQT